MRHWQSGFYLSCPQVEGRMADGKFLSIANAAGAIGGAVVGGLGVMFALGDTSPKSLSGMASSLDRIAENLEKYRILTHLPPGRRPMF